MIITVVASTVGDGVCNLLGHEKTFADYNNVLYLDRCLGYTDMCICRNASHDVFQIRTFILLCKFYLKKTSRQTNIEL